MISLQAEGLLAISRWLSAATPPVHERNYQGIPEGWQHKPNKGTDMSSTFISLHYHIVFSTKHREPMESQKETQVCSPTNSIFTFLCDSKKAWKSTARSLTRHWHEAQKELRPHSGPFRRSTATRRSWYRWRMDAGWERLSAFVSQPIRHTGSRNKHGTDSPRRPNCTRPPGGCIWHLDQW